jgi:hypothetical protein
MRHRWLSFLFCVLALAAQAMSLAIANATVAQIFAHRQKSVERCLAHSENTTGGRHQQSDHSDRGSCQECQACCEGTTPFEGRPTFLGMAFVQPIVLALVTPDSLLSNGRHEHLHQARAPPAFS